jgi:hypothetical protein
MNTKTQAERSEDIAYTINHALACTATDFIDPYFGNLTQKHLGTRFSIGCGHDHRRDAHHGHACDHHAHAPKSHLKQWWLGEVVGDFGAVPVTIFIQRMFPSLMKGLEKTLENTVGGFFRRGAEKSTRKWAEKYQISNDSQEYKNHFQEMYHYEIEHLPQALVWTASSIVINLSTQKLTGNHAPLWQLATGKAVGASISAGLVVGARGLFPGAAHRWDAYTSERLFLPATKAVGKLFGVEERAVERLAEKEKALKEEGWTNRIATNIAASVAR